MRIRATPLMPMDEATPLSSSSFMADRPETVPVVVSDTKVLPPRSRPGPVVTGPHDGRSIQPMTSHGYADGVLRWVDERRSQRDQRRGHNVTPGIATRADPGEQTRTDAAPCDEPTCRGLAGAHYARQVTAAPVSGTPGSRRRQGPASDGTTTCSAADRVVSTSTLGPAPETTAA